MKNSQKVLIGLLSAFIVLLVALAIVLFSCSGNGNDDPTTAPSSAVDTTDPTETTEPDTTVEDTTESDTTEPETTEPETTQASSGGNNPGGTGGFQGGGSNVGGQESTEPETTEPEETADVPEAGTEDNAYAETLGKLPDSFNTVSIPGKGSMHYAVSNAQGTVLTVEDENAYVVFNGKKYEAKEGVVTVEIPADSKDPVSLEIGNKGKKAASFEVKFTGPQGSESNPIEISAALFPVTTPKLAAGESVYYKAYNVGSHILTVPAGCTVTVNGQPFTSGDVLPAAGMGEALTIAVTNSGNQAASFTLEAVLPVGTVDNPAQLIMGSNEAISADGELYYYTYTAEEAGTLSITIDTAENGWQYQFENKTTSYQGDLCDHDYTPEATTGSFTVAAGDVVQLMIGCFDAANWSEVPDGTVSFTASFAQLGTQENPYVITEYPYTHSAAIGAGETVYFVASGVNGTTMTVTGGDSHIAAGPMMQFDSVAGTVTIADIMDTVLNFSLTNTGSAEATYVIDAKVPVGTVNNPAQLVIGSNEAVSAGGAVYYYTYTAPDAGTLSITIDAAENGWQYQFENRTTSQMGDLFDHDYTPEATTGSITVAAGDVVQLMIGCYDPSNWSAAPDGTVEFTASYEADPGTKSNPLTLSFYDFPATTAELAAGQTVYYNAYNVGGLVLTADEGCTITVNDQPFTSGTVLPATGRGMPNLIAVTNSGDQAASFTLTVAEPKGTFSNPETMVIGTNTANVEAGDNDGFYFRYTATEAGTLTITMTDETWQYSYDNSPYMSDDAEPVVTFDVPVEVGTVVDLSVNTYNPEDSWNTPAGEVSFEASFKGLPGTKTNPIQITSFSYTTEEIAAGKTVYYSVMANRLNGMILTADNGAELTLNDAAFTSGTEVALGNAGYGAMAVIGVTNPGAEAAEITLNATFPVGHPENPAQIEMSTNTATVKANSSDGYNYKWTATEEGTLTISMVGDGWAFTVNNLTAYKYGDTHFSDGDVTEEEVAVKAGDEITVMVNTYDPASWDTPAGEVSFEASFKGLPGTQTNPITINAYPYDTASIGAGETVYYMATGVNGMTMTVSGGDSHIAAGPMMQIDSVDGTATVANIMDMALNFSLTNTGNAAAVYTVDAKLPVGTVNNPAELIIGSNEAVSSNGNVYFYTYTAAEAGTLSITIGTAENGWQYQFENRTTSQMGDLFDHDYTPEATTGSIDVAAGDTVQLMIGCYDPSNWSAAPDGTVEFTASFKGLPGTQTNPITINAYPYETASIGAGETVYYMATGVNGMTMTVSGGDSHIAAGRFMQFDSEDGTATIADIMDTALTFSLTNTGNTAAIYTVDAKLPVGTVNNPAELIIGSNEAVSSNGNVYFYTYTAAEAGTLSITIGTAENGWQYQFENRTTSQMGDLFDHDYTPEATTGSIDVAAGDTVQLMIGCYDPSNWSAAPDGTVEFTASFTGLPGTQGNPIVISGDQYPYTTASIGAGETVYYMAAGVSGKVMTVTGGDSQLKIGRRVVTSESGIATVENITDPTLTFSLTNTGNAAAVYTVDAEAPVGTVNNPAELAIGSNEAVSAGGNVYYYTYTAAEAGTLSITIGTAENGWQYQFENRTTSQMGDLFDHDYTPEATTGSITVAAGDVVQLMIGCYDPNNWSTAPEGTVEFTASFEAAGSTGPQAASLVIGENTATVDAASAGKLYSYTAPANGVLVLKVDETAAANGWQLTVANSQTRAMAGTIYSCNGDAGIYFMNVAAGEQVNITVNTCGASDSAETPAGSVGFNASFEIGKVATVNSGSAVNNKMSYNIVSAAAESDGKLIIVVKDVVHYQNGNSMAFGLKPGSGSRVNYTAGQYAIQEVEITAGSTFTWGFSQPNYTTVNFTYEIILIADGSATEPESTEPESSEPESTEPESSVPESSVPESSEPESSEPESSVPESTEPESTQPETTLPAGPTVSDEDKDLVIGTNSANLAANDAQGVTFSWTATGDGVLIIDMGNDNASGWSFSLENTTAASAAITGNSVKADAGQVLVNVTEGDAISLVVNTGDTNGDTPAGKVSFTAELIADKVVEVFKSGTMLGDMFGGTVSTGNVDYAGQVVLVAYNVVISGSDPISYSTFRMTAPVDVHTQYTAGQYAASRVDIAAGENITWSFMDTVSFNEMSIDYKLYYIHEDVSGQAPIGSADNPKAVVDPAGIAVDLAAGDTEGFYYTYSAEKSGYLCVTAATMFDVTVTNKTKGTSGTQWIDGESYSPVVLSVSKNDEIIFFVKAHTSGQAVSGQFGASIEAGNVTEPINIAGDSYKATLAAGAEMVYGCRWIGRNFTLKGEGFSVNNPDASNTDHIYTDDDGDGIITFVPVANGDVAILKVKNTGSEAATFYMEGLFTLGSKSNPEEITEFDTYSKTLEKDSAGWFYQFTNTSSEEIGLKVTVSGASWEYMLGSGSIHRSDGLSTATHTQTVNLVAGQSILIYVNTEPTTSGQTTSYPAGTITVKLEQEAVQGASSSDPIVWTNVSTKVEIPAGATRYYALPASAAGKKLTVGHGTYGSINNFEIQVADGTPVAVTAATWSLDVGTLPAATGEYILVKITNTGSKTLNLGFSLIEQ